MPILAYARGRMCRRVRLKISGGNGVFVVISTVWGSMTRAPSVGPRYALIELPLLASWVSTVNFTSSAVSGSPLWNLTPRRRVKRHVVGYPARQQGELDQRISGTDRRR